MPRPKKNNAEYFSHDADASSDEKIIYLESEFGLKGYAMYFKTLEALTRSEGFEIEWSEIKCGVLARKFGVKKEEYKQFIVAATTPEVGAFCLRNDRLWSPGLKKRLAPLLERREKEAERIKKRREKQAKEGGSEVVAPTTNEVAQTSTQSKVKESKVKNILSLSQAGDSKKNESEPEGPATNKGGCADDVRTSSDPVEIIRAKVLSAPSTMKEIWQMRYGVGASDLKAVAHDFCLWWVGREGKGMQDEAILGLAERTGAIALRSSFEKSFLANHTKKNHESRNGNHHKGASAKPTRHELYQAELRKLAELE